MTSLQKKGESWGFQFHYPGKRHTFTIGKVEPDEAEARANQAEYLLIRIEQGLLTVPPGNDIVLFLQHDGKPPPQVPDAAEDVKNVKMRLESMDVNGNPLVFFDDKECDNEGPESNFGAT